MKYKFNDWHSLRIIDNIKTLYFTCSQIGEFYKKIYFTEQDPLRDHERGGGKGSEGEDIGIEIE